MNRLQAWWSSKQGLDQVNPSLSPAEVLEKAGWARSVGGASPYLTFFSRAETSREKADKDLAAQEIHELPCARGCTYIVPKSDYALALKVGQGFSDESAMNVARNFLGVTDAEIESLMTKVEDALKGGPLDPRELSKGLGDAIRNLGPEGKKRGQTTTLPLALGFLQSQGRIRRIPVNGRIDQQRYAYGIWSPSPMERSSMTREEAYAELAQKFFEWCGPASLAHFRWFSGLGVKVAKEAMAQLELRPIEGTDLMILADDLDAFESFKTPKDPIYSLVGCIDSITMLRRDLGNLLSPEDATNKIFAGKELSKSGHLMDLPHNAILDRGRVIGVWEYDPGTSSMAWYSFEPANADLKAAIAKTEAFARDQLGDVRTFSLDSPESRAPAIKLIREMAGN